MVALLILTLMLRVSQADTQQDAIDLFLKKWQERRHDSWVQVIAKTDTSFAFKNIHLGTRAPVCPDSATSAILSPYIEKELLLFFAEGDTINVGLYHDVNADNKLKIAYIVIHDAYVQVGKDITDPAFQNLKFFQARFRGQKLRLEIDTRKIVPFIENSQIIITELRIMCGVLENPTECRGSINGGNILLYEPNPPPEPPQSM